MTPLKSRFGLPLPAHRALKKLGADLRDARKRRRIRAEAMAQRAFVSRPTLAHAEAGDPTVGIGIYVTLLFLLGMTDRVADLADARHDLIGQSAETEPMRQPFPVTWSRPDGNVPVETELAAVLTRPSFTGLLEASRRFGLTRVEQAARELTESGNWNPRARDDAEHVLRNLRIGHDRANRRN